MSAQEPASPPSLAHARFDHEAFLPTIPISPGVYLMYDHRDVVMYVGKAKNLRMRVRQYFAPTPDPRPFVSTLPLALSRIQTLSTHNEKEALLLERTLILEHQPRHNVALKFNSGHLYLRLDSRVAWPKFTVTRKSRRDGAQYFGPYMSGSDLRAMLYVIERTFQVRTCDDRDFRNRGRPCLQYQIKRCSGPCVLPVDREEYVREVVGASQFLQGKHPKLLQDLRARMTSASKVLDFERAARFRDQIFAIERSLVPQDVAEATGDQDVIGLYREGDQVQVVILLIRQGKLLRAQPFSLEHQGAQNGELISTFLHLYYSQGAPPPREIISPLLLEDRGPLLERLGELRGGRVHLKVPQRGRLHRLLEMAQQNAEHAFFQAQRAVSAREETLMALKRLCHLSQFPRRIECYDVSIFQGEAPVASQVVFEMGLPRKKHYRTRFIREVEGTDDFAMMREALTRRLQRGIQEGDLPQLIVLDGGKGQLSVALATLSDLKLESIDVIALAKSRVLKGDAHADAKGGVKRSAERVFLPNVKVPIPLRSGTPVFRLLTQLRNEAHDTALRAHRRRRRKTRLESPIDQLPGIGPVKRKALLRALGSIKGVYEASVETLSQVSGITPNLARIIYDAFHEDE